MPDRSGLVGEVEAAFAADGDLAGTIEGYQPRAEQQKMALGVAATLEDSSTLLVEAGTGTGKTYAYLVPALLWANEQRKKVVISTGTKHLQDQLHDRDLPQVRDALGISVSTARLKGRANYLCWHRMEQAAHSQQTPDDQQLLSRLAHWAGHSKQGDIAESGMPEDWRLWPQVTSTVDNCLGQDCGDWDRCFVSKARQRAQKAELVVVNHHLLFADMVLRETGFAELLPSADAVIVDEAHQFPETATRFFGSSLSSRQLQDLIADSQAALDEAGAGQPALISACHALEECIRRFRQTLGEIRDRLDWSDAERTPGFIDGVEALKHCLGSLQAELEQAAERSKDLSQCHTRCIASHDRLEKILAAANDNASARWVESRNRSFVLQLSPLDVANELRNRAFNRPAAWVFTSATLAIGKNFSHYANRLGVDEPRELLVDSPFDYPNNALLYLPPGLPDPREPGFTPSVLTAVKPVLEASKGRAFLLFTSYRALNEAARMLRALPYPLFVQGEAPRGQLLEAFRNSGNGILLGTSAFWEGVDVRGEALSLVVIEKLPFASPGDPLTKARLDWLRSNGGNPFSDWQIPQAVIALKQGVGRLIRGVTDRGVLVLCDPRIQRSNYGRIFLASLPPMPRTDSLQEVEAFFAAEHSDPESCSHESVNKAVNESS